VLSLQVLIVYICISGTQNKKLLGNYCQCNIFVSNEKWHIKFDFLNFVINAK